MKVQHVTIDEVNDMIGSVLVWLDKRRTEAQAEFEQKREAWIQRHMETAWFNKSRQYAEDKYDGKKKGDHFEIEPAYWDKGLLIAIAERKARVERFSNKIDQLSEQGVTQVVLEAEDITLLHHA